MSEVRIYKLNLNAGDFSYSFFRSNECGGSDTPDANYPEFAELENIHRSENAGASGQHVADAIDTNDYTITWITLSRVGNLTGGQFDARGGGVGKPLKCRWKQFFKSSALNEAGISVPLTLCNVGAGGCGLFSGDRFFAVEMIQSSGNSFDWYGVYRRVFVSGSLTTTSMSGASYIQGISDVADDAEHEMIVTIVPSTVAGDFDGDNDLGDAVVATDGAFSVTVDGTEVVAASGLQFVINPYPTSAPGIYYGGTIWHGD